MQKLTIALTIGLAVLTLSPAAQAVTVSHEFNNTTGSWLDSGNWTPSGTPDGDDVWNVGQGTAQASGTFDDELNINAGGTLQINASTSSPAVAGDLHLAGGALYRSSSSNRALDGAITVDSASTLESSNETPAAIIGATLSGSGNLTRQIGVGTYIFTADNSGYSGNWSIIGGAVRFDHDNAAGSGTITVSTDGTLFLDASVTLNNQITVNAGGWLNPTQANDSTTTVTNLHLNGGGIYKTDQSHNPNLAGSIVVDADSTISDSGGTVGNWTLSATLSGPGRMTYTGGADINLTADNSGYDGGLTVDGAAGDGALLALHDNAFGTGELILANGGILWFRSNQNWTIANDLSGDGTFRIGTAGSSGSGNRTFILNGGDLNPGEDGAGVMIFRNGNSSRRGHVEFDNVGGTDTPQLTIDVVGGGAVAGVDYDQVLLIDGDVSGLAKLGLVINIDESLTLGDLAGDELTILLTNNGTLDATTVASYTVNGPVTPGTVTFNSDSIVLSDWQAVEVPEPATVALLALGGLALAGVRRRR